MKTHVKQVLCIIDQVPSSAVFTLFEFYKTITSVILYSMSLKGTNKLIWETYSIQNSQGKILKKTFIPPLVSVVKVV